MRLKALANSHVLSARMTPRLADIASGLSTTGYLRVNEISVGSSLTETAPKAGTSRPAASSVLRLSSLLRLASAAALGVPGRPKGAFPPPAIVTGPSPAEIPPPGGGETIAAPMLG